MRARDDARSLAVARAVKGAAIHSQTPGGTMPTRDETSTMRAIQVAAEAIRRGQKVAEYMALRDLVRNGAGTQIATGRSTRMRQLASELWPEPEPEPAADLLGVDADTREMPAPILLDQDVCVCGHTRHWHGDQGVAHAGTGACEAGSPCDCAAFLNAVVS